jgi:hypothetical protein
MLAMNPKAMAISRLKNLRPTGRSRNSGAFAPRQSRRFPARFSSKSNRLYSEFAP